MFAFKADFYKSVRGGNCSFCIFQVSERRAYENLFAALRALRADLARRESVPAYVIFSNATLADMAEKAPRSFSELLEVSGIGERKASRYGEAFLKAIEDYMNEHA